MSTNLLFKGGRIVTATRTYKADVSVRDGRITEIGLRIKADKETEVVDCAGKLLLPGAIDAHTHLAMPYAGTITADDYESGTRAAACGGTTTVFDFIQQEAGEPFPEALARRDKIAALQAVVDYSFHIGITDISNGLIDTMADAVRLGVPSFKVYMVYDFGVTDGVFYQVLEKSRDIGALIAVHAENNEMVKYLTAKYIAEKKTSPWYHYMSRPEFVEAEADMRAIQWAKNAGAPLYIVHLANKQGMDEVTKARSEGYPIFAETCPQYLNFTNEVYKRPDGGNFVCAPPIKDKASQDALWEGLRRGDISTVATDHCPFPKAEKDRGKNDFTKIPGGCAGVENMYPYMLSEANKGRITFNKAVEVCATNVAKIFGLDHQKGAIEAGRDADIVIYDPKLRVTVTNKKMHGATDHTIWEGTKLKGYPEATYSRGNLVYKNGKFLGKNGDGKFIKCKAIKLTSPDIGSN
jgi:dihydropyrimidinase